MKLLKNCLLAMVLGLVFFASSIHAADYDDETGTWTWYDDNDYDGEGFVESWACCEVAPFPPEVWTPPAPPTVSPPIPNPAFKIGDKAGYGGIAGLMIAKATMDLIYPDGSEYVDYLLNPNAQSQTTNATRTRLPWEFELVPTNSTKLYIELLYHRDTTNEAWTCYQTNTVETTWTNQYPWTGNMGAVYRRYDTGGSLSTNIETGYDSWRSGARDHGRSVGSRPSTSPPPNGTNYTAIGDKFEIRWAVVRVAAFKPFWISMVANFTGYRWTEGYSFYEPDGLTAYTEHRACVMGPTQLLGEATPAQTRNYYVNQAWISRLDDGSDNQP